MKKISVAFDMGNSGGKVLAATMDNGHLEILDERIIENEFVQINGRLYWDLFRIFRDLKEALRDFSQLGDVVSIAVDGTCGAYAFVNRNGALATYANSARDNHYANWKDLICQEISEKELYDETGVFPLGGNVLCKLACDFKTGEMSKDMNVVFLQLSGLMEFMLTGRMTLEHSMAGASVMMDKYFENWNDVLLGRLGIPVSMLPPIVPPGSFGAKLLPAVAEETNCPNCRFIHTVEFDSSTAMISAPGFDQDQIYLSMGTTINPGVELSRPIISDLAWKYKYKNVPVWPGSYMLLSDVPGFFLLAQCLKAWRKERPDIGHGELVELASCVRTESYLNLYDLNLTVACSDMPERVCKFCSETGQKVPEGIAQTARVLYESYAITIAWSIEKLKKITARENYKLITAISGGSRNALLCQMIADATGMKVSAGDPQATCLGNLLVQFYALGNLPTREAMLEEAGNVCEMKIYHPQNDEMLKNGYKWLTENGYLD